MTELAYIAQVCDTVRIVAGIVGLVTIFFSAAIVWALEDTYPRNAVLIVEAFVIAVCLALIIFVPSGEIIMGSANA